MLQSKTHWKIRQDHEVNINHFVNELNLTPLVARLLVNRGIETVEEAKSFLFHNGECYDPFLLEDMHIAIERINQAIRNKEKITVYGDYDADGVTSTYVLLSTLKKLGANVDFYIPNRFTEGYGPNEEAFRFLKDQGTDLIVTVDNGIAGIHEANVAKEIGLDLIITDHHEPGPELPDCLAIIHPKRPNSLYPFQELAGVGVAFKLATALLGEVSEELLPFVAIGTVGDLVSLKDENRLLVQKGLKLIPSCQNLGLKALLKVAGADIHHVNEMTIGFTLAPRINAPGRLEHADLGVHLFLTEDPEEAFAIAQEINDLNKQRQSIVDEIAKEAIAEFTENEKYKDDQIIVLGKENWHPGVIGIVASRLVETFSKPALVFSYDYTSGLAKGSARSIPRFDLFENLSKCRDLLPHFGGHKMAAGMTLKIEDVDKLRQRLNTLAKEQLTPEDFILETEIDGVISLDEINLETIEQMERLAPFGTDNPKPIIMVKDVQLPNIRSVGSDGKHLKMTMANHSVEVDGIGFNLGELADHISPLANVSLIGELDINEWNHIRKPQVLVKDIQINEWQLFDYRGHRKIEQWVDKLPKENCKFIVFQEESIGKLNLAPYLKDVLLISTMDEAKDAVIQNTHLVLVDLPPNSMYLETLLSNKSISRIYAYFYQEDTALFSTMPKREHFKWYYSFLRKQETFDIQNRGHDLAKFSGLSIEAIKFMTQVFFDLEFVKMDNGIVSIVQSPQKRNLTDSTTYKRRIEHMELEKTLLYSTYSELKKWFDQFIKQVNIEEENTWI
jgi:single-stranded-DNA-specific exonuclease